MTTEYLTRAQVAARLGIEPDTVTVYRYRGKFPAPDQTYGPTALWLPATIDAWKATRPGTAWRRGKGAQRSEPAD